MTYNYDVPFNIGALLDGYILQTPYDISSPDIRELFEPGFLDRLRQLIKERPDPRLELETAFGKFGVNIPVDLMVNIVTRDREGANILHRQLMNRLRRIERDGAHFLGLNHGDGESPRFKELIDEKGRWQSFPDNVSAIHNELVVVDGTVSGVSGIGSHNENMQHTIHSLKSAIPTEHGDITYVLANHASFSLTVDDPFLPIAVKQKTADAFRLVNLEGWYPFVRIVGRIRHAEGKRYLEAGLVMIRPPRAYGTLGTWLQDLSYNAALDVCRDTHNSRAQMEAVLKADTAESGAIQTGQWRAKLPRDAREALFLLVPAVSALVCRIENQPKYLSGSGRDVLEACFEAARVYYDSNEPDSPDVAFLEERQTYLLP